MWKDAETEVSRVDLMFWEWKEAETEVNRVDLMFWEWKEAEMEVNRVDLMLWEWKEATTIDKYIHQLCDTENWVFLIYKPFEGWTGGVWRCIFFSRGFQHAFSKKTVAKALDRDLDFV